MLGLGLSSLISDMAVSSTANKVLQIQRHPLGTEPSWRSLNAVLCRCAVRGWHNTAFKMSRRIQYQEDDAKWVAPSLNYPAMLHLC